MIKTLFKSEPSVRKCPLCKKQKVLGLLCMSAGKIAENSYNKEALEKIGLIPEDKFPIVICRHCDFVYSGKLLPPPKLNIIYEKLIGQETDLNYETSWEVIRSYLGIWHALFQGLDDDYTNNLKKLNVLDFGAGYGTFLSVAKAPRISVYGYETSLRRTKYMTDHGINTILKIKELFPKAPFDLIMCNQVLEHVPNPLDTLQILKDILARRGRLYLSVPCYTDDFLKENKRLYQEKEQYSLLLNPWEHLNYFSPQTFKKMLEMVGLKIADWPNVLSKKTSNGIICGYSADSHPDLKWTTAIVTHA